MQVTCSSCGRVFDLDEEGAARVGVALCVCGARLPLLGNEGRSFGKYTLVRRIATGGMGEIYYGKIAGIEGFEREVAIKKMLPHLSADRSFIEMLVKEAKLTVLLHHPNIVQVYDLSREGDEYYIAMEYVPGITVSDLLKASGTGGELLPVAVAVNIVLQVLRGLSYAHDLRGPDGEPINVLHRDITPQNILVTRDGWVKITDFGIAKALNEISTTGPGMIKGKLGYIAPEVLAGRQPDQRLDIFCAAIVLWEALAGRRLFKGEGEIDTLHKIAVAEVPPLSTCRHDVPPKVEQALRRGLAKEPEDRYATADELYRALNQAIFPDTADDCLMASKSFFAQHQSFFASLGDGDARRAEVTGVQGATLQVRTPIGDEALPSILEVTRRRRHGRRGRPLALAVAGLLLAASGGVGGWLALRAAPPAQADATTPQAPVAVAPLTIPEVQAAVDAAGERLRACYDGSVARRLRGDSPRATLTVGAGGELTAVVLAPPAARLGPAGECLEQALRGLSLRSNAGPSFVAEVRLPEPPSRPAPLATGPRHPSRPATASEQLTAADIQATIRTAAGSLAGCVAELTGSNPPPHVVATITITTRGRVGSVSFEPKIAVPKAERCLRKSLQALSFGKRPTRQLQVNVPIVLKRI